MNLHLDKVLFEKFCLAFFQHLKAEEKLSLTYAAEVSEFIRFSKAKIRQSTHVEQGFIAAKLSTGNKILNFDFPYTADLDEDLKTARQKLEAGRLLIPLLQDDPYFIAFENHGTSHVSANGQLPPASSIVEDISKSANGLDLAGLFVYGSVVRATQNSLGQKHWFLTTNFYLDYSLYNAKQKAVKAMYSAETWVLADFAKNLQESRMQLSLMDRSNRKVPRGLHRVYLAPSAVKELIQTLSWGGVSYGAHKQGVGSLQQLVDGQKKLSPLVSIYEDFRLNLSPRFNELGETAKENMPVIEQGLLKNLFTSSRTAKEYNVASNQAVPDYEGFRSPVMSEGTLLREEILKRLGTGLYISDLHYLNWSDRNHARITGMTRYACFWVENGEIVSPIEDLRFDESIYSIFGSNLEAVTQFTQIFPASGTYEQREVGGSKVPGILLSEFSFTL